MATQSIPEPGKWARMGLTLPHGYTQHPEVVVSLYYYKNLWCGKIHGLLRLATPASRYIKRCLQWVEGTFLSHLVLRVSGTPKWL